MIEDLHITSAAIKSPVRLHNKASFVKFGSSGTLISNLTKSPLVFHATVTMLRKEWSILQPRPYSICGLWLNNKTKKED